MNKWCIYALCDNSNLTLTVVIIDEIIGLVYHVVQLDVSQRRSAAIVNAT